MDIKTVDSLCAEIVRKLEASGDSRVLALHPVPRGGVPVAWALARAFGRVGVEVTIDEPRTDGWIPPQWDDSDLVVDDIYDSGRTLAPYLERGLRCAVLVVRDSIKVVAGGFANSLTWGADMLGDKEWITFSWEAGLWDGMAGPLDAVTRLLEWMGLDPNSGALRETPRRVVQWLSEFKAGQDMEGVATTFDGEVYDEMVLVRRIPFVSLCEHHLLPFVGTAAVAYIPQPVEVLGMPSMSARGPRGAFQPTDAAASAGAGPIIGLSKLARIVTWQAKRANVQERLTEDIRREVSLAAHTPHVAVLVEAEHMCMTLRGAKAGGSSTVTSALSGSFREDARTRAEFLAFASK